MLSGLLAPLLIGGMGFGHFDPSWWKFGVLIASMLSLGIGAAGVQQSGNNRAKDIKLGKDANSVTAIAQLFKSIGSFTAYMAFSAGMLIFGQWTAMFPILATVALANMFFSTKATRASKVNYKFMKTTATAAQVKAAAKPKKSIAQRVKGYIPELLYKDSFVTSLFFSLFLFCGSEIVLSQATKSILQATLMKTLTAALPFLAAGNSTAVALTTLINGVLTMGPVMLGRMFGGKIQNSAKDVKGYVQKLLTLSAAFALAGTAAVSYMKGDFGALALIPVFLANLGFANLFSLSFGIVKDHVKDEYAKDKKTGLDNPKYKEYSAQAGTISTLALTACWALPSFVAFVVPASESVFSRIPLATIAVAIGIALLTIISIARKTNFFASNPFSWKRNATSENFVNNPYADIMNVYRADKISKYINKKSIADVDKYAAKLETKLSAMLGITSVELNEALTGFMKDSKTRVSEKEQARIQSAIKKTLADKAGLTPEEVKALDKGTVTQQTRNKIDAALDEMLKAAQD